MIHIKALSYYKTCVKNVVLVEPEIPENTGFIARLSANFGFDLRIVNPEFNLSEARKTASGAQQKLRDARIFDSVEEAVEDLEFVVGTKPGRGVKMEEMEPREDTSVMIGRESSGLSNEELELCDAVTYIDTIDYESINQSHAAAILLHHFSGGDGRSPAKQTREHLKQILSEKNYELIMRSNPTSGEINRLIGEIKQQRD
jgi:TrmH family RNA methyltransferase